MQSVGEILKEKRVRALNKSNVPNTVHVVAVRVNCMCKVEERRSIRVS